ncbi:WD repeat-containing protein 43 [Vigna unguiculata]|uniref:U3 small nucleolar RNA-associated protein 5 n=1 Tax=Vigna unguiculata TaxID=3917 RepID=A0A4D6MMU5_VIGUN|nr:WD repeat-containing protein 43 [Vigna unguiculata]XP_027906958.1 WD repeat-containing protein 43 [Vigna unguiculata]QCE02094.1 U3 small nucleolar RNA-associated protein 5 [Vigna unguiculata]
MGKGEAKKHVLTAFTPKGDYAAILSAKGTAKIWNTSTGHLLAEWKPSDGDNDLRYSCIASSYIGKKFRKEQGTFLLALGTIDGRVLAVDVSTGERKLITSYPGEICGLSFANKGRVLRIVGRNGMAYEVNSETGQLLKEFKVSKKSITSLAFSHDEKYLAIVSSKIRVISWEIGKEVLKFPNDLENVQHISISNDAKNLVASDFEGKHLHVWKCDLSSGNVSRGPTLPIRHPPVALDCRCGYNKEEVTVLLAVSGRGSAYIWNLNAFSEDQIQPTKLTTKTKIVETDKENGGSSKKRQTSIIASRLQPIEEDKQVKALVTYCSVDHPQFSVVNINNSGETIVLNVEDETDSVHQHDSPSSKAIPTESKKTKKRQAPSDPDVTTDVVDLDQHEAAKGVLLDNDLDEPTMGEKLASLSLLEENKFKSDKEQEDSVSVKPPSADSVHVLIKQALNADDRTLLLDCLYTQDEKVIRKSIAQLNPSNVLKLLYSLISIIESRGAILACALPWLKYLLLQHASGILSQESSLKALNSLYQLIESRVSTFKSAIQLSSCLDILYSGVIDEEDDEDEIVPVIFEDKDSSEEESDEEAMETGQDITDEEESEQELDGASEMMEED